MILRRGPRTGAQLIDDMEVMTRGWWRPSPGSVYPLLEELVAEGALRRYGDGRYELTASAAAESSWSWLQSPRTPREVVTELGGLTSYLEDLARTDPAASGELADELKNLAQRLQRLGR